MTYLDTSALVKRFVSEIGSGEVRRLVFGDGPIACATIAYVELHSGLTRRHREGALLANQLSAGLPAFLKETGWPSSGSS